MGPIVIEIASLPGADIALQQLHQAETGAQILGKDIVWDSCVSVHVITGEAGHVTAHAHARAHVSRTGRVVKVLLLRCSSGDVYRFLVSGALFEHPTYHPLILHHN